MFAQKLKEQEFPCYIYEYTWLSYLKKFIDVGLTYDVN